MKRLFKLFVISLCLFSTVTYANINKDPAVQQFINEMVRDHGFNRMYLKWVFYNTHFDPKVLAKVQAPAEGLTWDRYRKIFLKEDRINKGVKFWRQHEKRLNRAAQQFGVPPSIIVAILGVETKYGEKMGDFKAINALSTLAFKYPRRSAFYRKELKQFLILSRKVKLNPLKVKGSYSGAMGQSQFMPSSYLAYGYGVRHRDRPNLFNNADDIIFSIANYMEKNGWERGGPITTRAQLTNAKAEKFAMTDTRKFVIPRYTIQQLKKHGVVTKGHFDPNRKASFMELTGAKPEFWLGFQNFYAITRYNNSMLYAMAVYQLSQEMEKKKG